MSMQPEKDLIPIDYDEVIHETPLAWLLNADDKEFWIPKSECSIVESINGHDNYCLMPEWLAYEKGLI